MAGSAYGRDMVMETAVPAQSHAYGMMPHLSVTELSGAAQRPHIPRSGNTQCPASPFNRPAAGHARNPRVVWPCRDTMHPTGACF